MVGDEGHQDLPGRPTPTWRTLTWLGIVDDPSRPSIWPESGRLWRKLLRLAIWCAVSGGVFELLERWLGGGGWAFGVVWCSPWLPVTSSGGI